MSTDEANPRDEAQAEVTPGEETGRKSYTVVSEAGLFKNGKQYKKGSTVELDEATAANFIAAGDVEE